MKKITHYNVVYVADNTIIFKNFPNWKAARRFMRTHAAYYCNAVIVGA